MPSRRWLTAWELLRSGNFKEFSIRSLRLFRKLKKRKTGVNYSDWREKWVELNQDEKELLSKQVVNLSDHPSFSLLLSADEIDPALFFSTIKSVLTQIYPNWVLHLSSESSLSSDFCEEILLINDNRIKLADPTSSDLGEWVTELLPGTTLHEAALFSSAVYLVENPEAKIVYSDHDHVNIFGNFCDPHMKPDWNPDLFAAMNYLEPFVLCKKEIWEACRSKKIDKHSFLLEATRGLSHLEISHNPQVLASVHVSDAGSHVEPLVQRVQYDLPFTEPLVSILIPTHNQGTMLEKCLESIYEKTNYTNFEIVLVDHETDETKALKVIEEFRTSNNFRVLNYSGSFNFAAMMNRAAEFAEGQVLVLLNNDTEIVDSGWLKELVSQVSRPEVGVAGALLLFGDNTVQHAGVHPGLGGLMGHGHKHLPANSSGYFNRLKAVHSVAAVTGACLAVEKSTWVDLEGLDEENLAVAYNDIDFCFKARAEGLRVVFTPYAKLLHHESVSRGFDEELQNNQRLQKEVRTMVERWGDFLEVDPAYSPNLSFDGGGFKLNQKPTATIKTLLQRMS